MALRSPRRLTLALCFAVATSATAGFVGCSDDSSATAGDAGPDATADLGAPNEDGATNADTGGDAGTDAAIDAYVCADTPFDCNAVPDAGSDAASEAGADGGADAGIVDRVPYYLRCTGLYACWSDKRVAPDHRAYTPGLVLWSDGAQKSRWIYLPPGQKIDTTNPDEWIFPVGTKIYKEFVLGGKRVETRGLWKAGANDWVYSVWQWDSTGTQATLANGGAVIAGALAPNYEIANTAQCALCHQGHADKALGFDAWSLGVPAAQGVTLAQLAKEGSLSSWPWTTHFALPQDATGKLDKAEGFFYNNCGFCHKPAGLAAGTGLHLNLSANAALGLELDGGAIVDGGVFGDASATIPAAQTPVYVTAVDQPHVGFTGVYPPASGYKRIVKGNASLSVVPLRDSLVDPDGGIAPRQMPPMLRRAIDDAGISAEIDWINSLQ